MYSLKFLSVREILWNPLIWIQGKRNFIVSSWPLIDGLRFIYHVYTTLLWGPVLRESTNNFRKGPALVRRKAMPAHLRRYAEADQDFLWIKDQQPQVVSSGEENSPSRPHFTQKKCKSHLGCVPLKFKFGSSKYIEFQFEVSIGVIFAKLDD